MSTQVELPRAAERLGGGGRGQARPRAALAVALERERGEGRRLGTGLVAGTLGAALVA